MTSPLVCLVVLDGWGLAPPGPGNAVELADTPTFDRLWAAYPHTQLDASGRAVGLPDGQMGNSEVGHTNLGAGRVVRQDLVRIDDDIESGAFFENPVLVDACRKARGSALHLLGLVSDGGVHSHLRHLRALIELASREDVEHVHVHAFMDGRDTSPHGGAEYLDGLPGVATVVGRYYAMDRDRRWDRAKRAYDAIVHGVGARADDPVEAVKASYAAGVTDEFIEPVVIGDPSAGRIRSGDAAIFFNFRPDRARELSWALTQAGFTGFEVLPIEHDSTRLVIRGRGPANRSWLGTSFDRAIFEPAHFVMERRMMTGLAGVATGHPRSSFDDDIQIVLWAITFALIGAAKLLVVFRDRWQRPLAGFASGLVVFQVLTLAQPHVLVGCILVAGVAAVLWWPAERAHEHHASPP